MDKNYSSNLVVEDTNVSYDKNNDTIVVTLMKANNVGYRQTVKAGHVMLTVCSDGYGNVSSIQIKGVNDLVKQSL